MHALTGCDSVSSFVGRGKIKAYKLLEANPGIAISFSQMGLSKELDPDVERYVCLLYDVRETGKVNAARHQLFTTGGMTECSLPPTHDALTLHSAHASYQSHIWFCALDSTPDIAPPKGFGWHLNGTSVTIQWIIQPIAPPEILQIALCRCLKSLCSCRSSSFVCTAACRRKGYENKEQEREIEAE